MRDLARQATRLEALLEQDAETELPARIEGLEQAMRREGIPVGLEPATRAGREMARVMSFVMAVFFWLLDSGLLWLTRQFVG